MQLPGTVSSFDPYGTYRDSASPSDKLFYCQAEAVNVCTVQARIQIMRLMAHWKMRTMGLHLQLVRNIDAFRNIQGVVGEWEAQKWTKFDTYKSTIVGIRRALKCS
jgi:hypothetical protein